MIKILFLTSNPQDILPLQLDIEMRAIDQALRLAEHRDHFDLRQHWAVQINDLQELMLRHRPHIIHFSGHGIASGEIVLQSADHKARTVSPDALSNLFGILQGDVRCVVLNACDSEAQANAIAEHVDCVIGMSDAISDEVARNFSAALYSAFAYGCSVHTAFKMACNSIDLTNLPQSDIPHLLALHADPAEIFLIDGQKDAITAHTPTSVELVETNRALRQDFGVSAQSNAQVTERLQGPTEKMVIKMPFVGDPPYKGMAYYDVVDADLFFGREALTAELVDYLAHHSLLAIIGASGSGKSSLTRAGLLPALLNGQPIDDSSEWDVHVITPTHQPLRSLAATLTRNSLSVTTTTTLIDDLAQDTRSLDLYIGRLLSQPNNVPKRLLLVIDQFEELFTLCRNKNERRSFIENLLIAAGVAKHRPKVFSPEEEGIADPDSEQPQNLEVIQPKHLRIVLTLRADFYAHCSEVSELRAALERYQKYIGMMTPEEMRRAIEGPARNIWDFQSGLVEQMLEDVGYGENQEPEPGSLPLLSHALRETWERRNDRTMTLAGYREAGSVQGAIAQTAQSVIDGFNDVEQDIARFIFLRMTELGEGSQDTRRRVLLDELFSTSKDRVTIESVLKILADSRLVVTSSAVMNSSDLDADVDATYIEVSHEALIREWPTLREWLNNDREGLRMHRRLSNDANEWHGSQDVGILYRGARLESIQTWVAEHPSLLNQREQSFLDTSQETVDSEVQAREEARLRELEQQRSLAEAQRLRAEENAKSATTLRRRAIGLGVVGLIALIFAGVAGFFADTSSKNFQTANENLAISRSAEATATRALATSVVSLATSDAAKATAISSEQDAIIAQETAVIAQGKTERELRNVTVGALAAHVQAKIGQGNYANDTTLLLARAAVLTTLENGGYVLPEAEISLRNAEAHALWEKTFSVEHPHTRIDAVAWHPSNESFVSVGDDNTVHVWDVETGRSLQTLKGPDGYVLAVKRSADGILIAPSSQDGGIHIWNSETGRILQTLKVSDGYVGAVEWSADGTLIASSGEGGDIYIWDAETGESLQVLKGHGEWVHDIKWSADRKRLVSVENSVDNDDDTIRTWDINSGKSLSAIKEDISWPSEIAWSADGQHIVTISWNPDSGYYQSKLRIWDAETGSILRTLNGCDGLVDSVTWSPDNNRILSGCSDGSLYIWDARKDDSPRVLKGHNEGVDLVEWSADGDYILSVSDNQIRIWDANNDQILHELEKDSWHISSVSWSADSKSIIFHGVYSHGSDFSGSYTSFHRSSLLGVWNTETGERRFMDGYGGYISSMAWSRDNMHIVSGTLEGHLSILDTKTANRSKILVGHTDSINAVAWSADGKYISSSGDQTVRIWEAETGNSLKIFEGDGDSIKTLAWSNDGNYIVSDNDDNIVQIWNVQTGKIELDNENLDSIIWSGDGKRIISGKSQPVSTIPIDESDSVAWSADGKYIVSSPNILDLSISEIKDRMQIWNTETSDMLITYERDENILETDFGIAAWDTDGKHIASGSAKGIIRIWNITPGEALWTQQGDSSGINSVAWSEDGERILSRSTDGSSQIWDIKSGNVLNLLNEDNDADSSVAWSTNGKQIVSMNIDKTLNIWDAETGENLHTVETELKMFYDMRWIEPPMSISAEPSMPMVLNIDDIQRATPAFPMVLSADGNRVLAHTDETVFIVDVNSGKVIKKFEMKMDTNFEQISSAAWSHDDKRIAIIHLNGLVSIINVDTRDISSVRDENSVGFYPLAVWSRDGKYIVGGGGVGDDIISIWDVETGQALQTREVLQSVVLSIDISADGTRIVSGSADGTIRIWDTETGRNLWMWEGHTSSVNSVAWSRDGRYIVSGSSDGTIRIWPGALETTLARLESRLERPSWKFTPEEQEKYGISDELNDWLALILPQPVIPSIFEP